MKKVEVFGTGCKKCMTTEEMIKAKAEELAIEIELIKVDDPVDIVSRGIMSTPAVMVDGKLVHKGGLPRKKEISKWLQ
jgi:small redox-active disulfide protein 2